MRKIVASAFISLDGVVEAPNEWHFPYFNDEMGVAVTNSMGSADTMLFGRTTYESFAGAWPDREAGGEEDAGFATVLGDMRKIVLSHSPLELTWRNSEQMTGDFVPFMTALKQSPGGTIALSGSISVVRQLLAAGLLDELHLLVHPIVLHSGLRLFAEDAPHVPLTLLSSETFKTGVLNLVYAPAPAPGAARYEEAKQHLP